MSNPSELAQQIQMVILKEKDHISPEIAPFMKEALHKILIEDMSPKNALGFTEEKIEEMYDYSYRLFQGGKFNQALAICHVLNRLDSTDTRFIFAMAACCHHMQNYPEAIGYYLLYEALDPTNPFPYYHLYDCFLKSGKTALALDILKIAYQLVEKDSQYTDLKGKIEMEMRQFNGNG